LIRWSFQGPLPGAELPELFLIALEPAIGSSLVDCCPRPPCCWASCAIRPSLGEAGTDSG
jgi:hypothetical protein